MEVVSGFLNMGGYAAFIWPAYGITTIVLIGSFLLGLRFQRLSKTKLKVMELSSRPHLNSSKLESGDEA
jgi:heme exporter protein D